MLLLVVVEGGDAAGVVGEAASLGFEVTVGIEVSEMVTGDTAVIVVVVVGFRGGGDGLATRLL